MIFPTCFSMTYGDFPNGIWMGGWMLRSERPEKGDGMWQV